MPPFFDACRSYGVKHVVMMTVMHADTMTMLPHHKAERQFIAALTKASSAAYNEVSPLAHTLEPLRPLVAATDAGDEPASEAAATESAAESAPVSPGRPTFTLVRPSWFMENLTRPGIHLPDILETDELYMPAGTGRVHLVHGSDVGEVVARLLVDNADGERPHAAHCDTAYAITSAQALTFAEVSGGQAVRTLVGGSAACCFGISALLIVCPSVWCVADRGGAVGRCGQTHPIHKRMGGAVCVAHHAQTRPADDASYGHDAAVQLGHCWWQRGDTHADGQGLIWGPRAAYPA